jgi:hypothetical protein
LACFSLPFDVSSLVPIITLPFLPTYLPAASLPSLFFLTLGKSLSREQSSTAGWCLPEPIPTFDLDTRATRFLTSFSHLSAPVPLWPDASPPSSHSLAIPRFISCLPPAITICHPTRVGRAPRTSSIPPPRVTGSRFSPSPPRSLRSSFLPRRKHNTRRLLRALPFARGIGPATVSSYGPSSLAHSRHIDLLP